MAIKGFTLTSVSLGVLRARSRARAQWQERAAVPLFPKIAVALRDGTLENQDQRIGGGSPHIEHFQLRKGTLAADIFDIKVLVLASWID
ncbi:hypothetical protein F4804DRAFT_333218 [Jackrogersella minutella]|nr:hypothetical protein F4804DRAFT_333218 [Jackrogersella minutella]